MQGEEKKKRVARNDYLNLYKESATSIKKEEPDQFTVKAEKETSKSR